MAFKQKGFPMHSGISPLKDHKKDKEGNVIEHLSDEEVDAKYEEFKIAYDNATTEEERVKLRETFQEETNIHKRTNK